MTHALGVERLRYGITRFRDPARNWPAFTYRPGKDSWTYFGNIEDYRTGYSFATSDDPAFRLIPELELTASDILHGWFARPGIQARVLLPPKAIEMVIGDLEKLHSIPSPDEE